MTEKLLIATVGLPRSGKTTWALNYAQSSLAPIVNPEAVRLAIHGQRYAAVAERYVWSVDIAIRCATIALRCEQGLA